MTITELLALGVITVLIIAVTCIIYQMFQQTEVVGVLKWGFLLISLSCSGARSKSN